MEIARLAEARRCGTRTAGVALALLVAGCASRAGLSVTPAVSSEIDLYAFPRVWVAGFLTNERRDIDLNAELVRLLRSELKAKTSLHIVDAAPLAIAAQTEFADRERWKALAEEYGEPLILTGIVRLKPAAPLYSERQIGRSSRAVLRKGLVLEAILTFIDGRTGDILACDRLPNTKLYGADSRASTLSLYFQIMDRVMPHFLGAIGVHQEYGTS